MSPQNTDILVEIPDDCLNKLANLYEEKAPWAPHLVSFIHTAMKWKKSGKYRNAVKIFSPMDSWETDGTIIARIILTVNKI